MLEVIAIISILFLLYIYYGYGVLLKALVFIKNTLNHKDSEFIKAEIFPTVTILISVHNEVSHINERLKNIFACDYPIDKLEVVIVSDASDDGTDELIVRLDNQKVQLLRVDDRVGKTGAQNYAMQYIVSEIVIYTDANASFDRAFIKNIVRPFDNPGVGASVGHLLFITKNSSGVSKSQGYYWRYELLLRKLESKLNILAVSSGSCLALRKRLFIQMDDAYGDDCIIPLTMVNQNYRVVFADNAFTFDEMPYEPSEELRTRIRMTLRNWQCTWSVPSLLNPLINPGVAFSLWSHKILRWLSPFFLIVLIVSSNSWALISGDLNAVVLSFLIDMFLLLSIIGFIINEKKISIPGSKTAFSFALANIGFFIGVIRALLGHKIRAYEKVKSVL